MAIILPTGYSTFADSTTTEGAPLKRYVLAQFRSDADLSWVGILRGALVVDELKWKHVEERRARLKAQPFWPSIEAGVGQATIVVIDPTPIAASIRRALDAEGAEEGVDFDKRALIDRCATALIGGTPLAYLPNEMARVIPWWSREQFLSLDSFTPKGIRDQIGPGLRDAMVFAARAHAMFDVGPLDEAGPTTRDAFRSPLSTLVLAEILGTPRVFDTEHPKSVGVLNLAARKIAEELEATLPTAGTLVEEPLVREVDSRAIDHIQAADIAAGWARETLEIADQRALANRFERVWVNGNREGGNRTL